LPLARQLRNIDPYWPLLFLRVYGLYYASNHGPPYSSSYAKKKKKNSLDSSQ
jgi:hypothetical protein